MILRFTLISVSLSWTNDNRFHTARLHVFPVHTCFLLSSIYFSMCHSRLHQGSTGAPRRCQYFCLLRLFVVLSSLIGFTISFYRQSAVGDSNSAKVPFFCLDSVLLPVFVFSLDDRTQFLIFTDILEMDIPFLVNDNNEFWGIRFRITRKSWINVLHA